MTTHRLCWPSDADAVENLNSTFPNGLSAKYLLDGHGFNMARFDAMQAPDNVPQLRDVISRHSGHLISIFNFSLRPSSLAAMLSSDWENLTITLCSSLFGEISHGVWQNWQDLPDAISRIIAYASFDWYYDSGMAVVALEVNRHNIEQTLLSISSRMSCRCLQ